MNVELNDVRMYKFCPKGMKWCRCKYAIYSKKYERSKITYWYVQDFKKYMNSRRFYRFSNENVIFMIFLWSREVYYIYSNYTWERSTQSVLYFNISGIFYDL